MRTTTWVALLSFAWLLPATASAEGLVPAARKHVLSNGLTVLLRPDSSVPLVAVELRSRAGAINDPLEKRGLASMTGALMMYGTQSRSEDQLSNQLAELGATLGTGAGTETLYASGNVPTIEPKALDRYLALFADVVLRPSFPSEGVDRARNRRVGQLKGLLDKRSALADMAFRAWLYPEHPYGRSPYGTIASIGELTRADVEQYHAKHLVPQDTAIGLSGDFDADDMLERLEELFGKKAWPRGEERADPFARLRAPRLPPGVRILLVDTGDETLNQAQFRLGTPLKRRYTDAGWHAFHLASQVLGGDFTARLNDRLRVKEGLTYGARWRNQDDDALPGAGFVSTYTSPRDLVRALKITWEEIDKFRRERLPNTELQRVQQRIVRGFVFRFETAQSVLSEHMDLWQEKLPIAHLANFPERIARLTRSDLDQVSVDFPNKDYSIVVVGNQALVEPLTAYAKQLGGRLEVVTPSWLGL